MRQTKIQTIKHNRSENDLFINMEDSCIFVIFGDTGDIIYKKLIPKLNILYSQNLLPKKFAILCIGRKLKTQEEYKEELLRYINSNFNSDFDDLWIKISNSIYYYSLNFRNEKGYIGLKRFLNYIDDMHDTKENIVFYLATAPKYFEIIIDNLNKNEMLYNEKSFENIVIDRTLGSELEYSRYLNNKKYEFYSEEKVSSISKEE